jgi:anti-sigma factor RsiW
MRLLRRRPRRHEITCQQAVDMVMDYLDGRLPDDDRTRLETHLAECAHCIEHLSQIQVTIAAAGTVRDDDLDPLAREDLMNLYRSWRRDHCGDGNR